MIEQNYRGYLIAAHPRRQDPLTKGGALLIIDHDSSGAIGLQINRALGNDVSFDTVMQNVGLTTDHDGPLYNGGPEHTNRIHIVHSLDWYSPTTMKITEEIGVSNDMSVLVAIAQGEGPELFRAVAGFTRWPAGYLEGEILGEAPWTITDTWNFAPATPDMVFGTDDLEQWHQVIYESGRLQVSNWF